MATKMTLARVQDWMQAFVVDLGSEDEAWTNANGAVGISDEDAARIILPSKTLTPIERMEVYRGMYFLRMRDALKVDYSVLQHFLSDDGFDELIEEYVKVYPSRSYNLNRLSDHLPEYIKSAEWLPHRGFAYDLARLELVVAQVFDAEESPKLTVEAIQSVPTDAWETACLRPVKAFQLLAFKYPVNDYLQAVRDNLPRPRARRQDSWLAVYRRDYSVWRLDLTRPAYELLQALASGIPLGEAIFNTTRRFSQRSVKEQIHQWFSQWMAQGIFQSVELPS